MDAPTEIVNLIQCDFESQKGSDVDFCLSVPVRVTVITVTYLQLSPYFSIDFSYLNPEGVFP